MAAFLLIPWIAASGILGFGDNPGRLTYAQLREMAALDVRSGFVKASPAKVWVVGGRYLRSLPAWASFPDSGLPDAEASLVRLLILRRQYEVEAIRRDRATPPERAFWDPILAGSRP